MAYPYYPNNQYYMQNMQDLQNMREKIDRQMQQMQQFNQNQMQQQPTSTNLTQNFQLAPMQNNSELEAKYVNNIDDVKNTFVMKEGIFVNRDMNTLWTKNVSGDIKSYSLQEIIEIDPKDAEIANLKNELANMRAMLQQQIVQPKEISEPEIAPVKEKKSSK